ncbi:hypothetical protein ACXQF3_003932 [Vibrio fluvialis]|uniref:hypothetical protein n=1 Tax=Vibrio fluvialis TaxID=676 RepID=UPI001C9D1BAF|nr:hypothetical protein [Vibrio fluvialis]ELD1797820.1 hypothetical protein [Vibrio fluvialis]MBY7936151.1 hypothetical protein [Vibrio fluvialis]MCE7580638.1 hypothetical protein [Vibrio fluvialis]
MLTKDITQELEAILTSLHNEGKEPGVALVKARLSTSVPMPALITAIKSWKSANRVPKIEIAATSANETDRISVLEQQVADLTQRLQALEAKLAGHA